MTKRVAVQTWQATSNAGDYIAQVACVAATDTSWVIDILGNPPATREAGNFKVQYALVDNFANGAACTFSFGPFTYTVARYTRQAFAFPTNQGQCALTLSAGQVNITFAQRRELLNESADAFAIQQAANQFVTYTWITKSAGGGQAATDQNKNISLSNASAQNYTLLGIAGSSIVNGWFNPIIANDGAGRWSIVPNGSDQINSIYTAAIPLQLSTGDKVEFWCDGSQWRAKGTVSYFSGQQVMTAAGTLTLAHGLAKIPNAIELWCECITAEFGYSIGDFLALDYFELSAGVQFGTAMTPDATNINVRYGSAGAGFAIPNKTTGASQNTTNANWRLHIRAYVFV